MKKLLLASTLMACLSGYSQKDSSYLELGLNVFPLIKTIQSGSSDLMINPYAFTAEYVVKSKFGVRAGVGFSSNSTEELPSLTNGNNTFINDTSSMDLRFGLFLNKKMGEKWTIKYGVDAVIENRSGSENTIFTDASNQRNETLVAREYSGFGVAPFLFAQYHLSKSFSVGTELSFRFINGSASRKTENTQFPDFNTELKEESTSNTILWPTALFLNIRF